MYLFAGKGIKKGKFPLNSKKQNSKNEARNLKKKSKYQIQNGSRSMVGRLLSLSTNCGDHQLTRRGSRHGLSFRACREIFDDLCVYERFFDKPIRLR